MSASRSRLEYFPDEILLEIFKHVSLHDLYHGFYNLNYRINYILHSVNELPLTLNKPDEINDRVVCFFARRISHLVVRHSKTVHFARFPSLRSLISLFPHDEQLSCIRSEDLPHLIRLTLGFMAVSNGKIIVDLCERIFSNEFPKLSYCSLWPPTFRKDLPTTRHSLIAHVQLQETTFDDLCTVLDACPHLKHLQIQVSRLAKAPRRLTRHLFVERLDASFTRYDASWLEKLVQLLALVPHIERLTIKICLLHVDLNHLHRILQQHLADAARFRCEIHGVRMPFKLQFLRRYGPLFRKISFEDIRESEKCRCTGFKLCLQGEQKV